MRQRRWARCAMGLALLFTVGGVRTASADVTSDRAAAILDWPSVVYSESGIVIGPLQYPFALDTIIQLSNTSTDPVHVHCFYENANAHCTNTGQVCSVPQECCDSSTGCGICLPGWNETDFHVQITPRQPLGWLVSEGVSGYSTFPPKEFGTFAIDGVTNFGIGGSSNAASRIPPVPEEPFIGSLRCIVVDEDGIPIDRNVIKGEATIGATSEGGYISVGEHNAIGLQAIEGAVNDDNVLVIGGPDAEYNGCPNFLILNHFFDGAEDPVDPLIGPNGRVFTVLDLVPCSQDYLRQEPGGAVVQYLVYNEFEQRFSTSRPMECKQLSLISNIDTTQNERSIFSAGVAGTLTGQTRINPIGNGLLGVAHEINSRSGLADFNLHFQGDRANPDFIVLP